MIEGDWGQAARKGEGLSVQEDSIPSHPMLQKMEVPKYRGSRPTSASASASAFEGAVA